MAARLNPKHDARTRDKIKTSQLINRLEAFVFGKNDPTSKKPVEMAPHQVTAALGLLRKTLPDLSNATVEHSGTLGVEKVLGDIDGRTAGLSEDQEQADRPPLAH